MTSKRAAPSNHTQKGCNDQNQSAAAPGQSLGQHWEQSQPHSEAATSPLAKTRVSRAISTGCLGKFFFHLCIVFWEREGCGLKHQGLMQTSIIIIIIAASSISPHNFLQETRVQHADITIKALYNTPLTIRCQSGAIKVRRAGM